MSGKLTWVLAFLAAAGAAQAMETAEERLIGFATCAGRLSALMEFQWLIHDPEADQTELVRANLIDILDAVMPPDRGREVFHWRIEAKMAHAALLHRGRFNQNAADALWARRLAAEHSDRCRSYLLS